MSCIGADELLLSKKKQSYVLTLIVVFILLAVLIFLYFFAFVPIDGKSMENTIYAKQYCFVQRKCLDINRGDIVIIDVADSKAKDSHDIVKRVIGLSGDKLIFMRGKDSSIVETYICKSGDNKFKKLSEPYIKENMKYSASNFYQIPVMLYSADLTTYDLNTLDHQTYAKIDAFITYVPQNHVFFLGDNRNISRDSRYYGTRSLDKVKYKVLSVMY